MIVTYTTRLQDGAENFDVLTRHEADDPPTTVLLTYHGSSFEIPVSLAEALSNAIRAHVNRRYL